MELSRKIRHLTGEAGDGWTLFYKARRMMDDGVAVADLTIGEHDVRTDASILDQMLASARSGNTGYAPVPGVRSLRETVARRVQERTGVPTGKDNILITPGGQSALFAAHVAVCDEGDRALYCDPYYATYPGTIRGAGAEAVRVELDPENAFQPQAADILPVADRARSLLINTPNNPTGVVYSRSTLEEIAGICREKDIWLISDEVYDTQIWTGEHVSPRSLPGMAERTLVVGSMSKSHAMTGSRVGWLIGPEAAISHLINLATHTTYGVPGYIQDAARFALDAGPELEEKIAAPFRRRRQIASKIISGQNLVKMVPADGAMYVMLDIRGTGLSGERFADALLDRHAIAVMPGESFGRAAAGHVRVAMTLADDDFAHAFETLVGFAGQLAA